MNLKINPAIIALSFSTCPAWAALTVVSPFGSIQEAINNANAGDIIEVPEGIYRENIDFLGKQIVLRSVSGASGTVIDAGGSGIAVKISGMSEITGFTITGGRASFGGGMEVAGIGTRIIGNVFDGNTGTGAAIWGNGSSPLISGNLFTRNSSDSQFLSAAVSFVNSSSPRIENNVFRDNIGRGINLTLPTGNRPLVVNNTFVGNTSAIRIDARVDTSGITVRNNIISSNQIGLEVDFKNRPEFASWEFNLTAGNDADFMGIASFNGTAGNFAANPGFIDILAGDFHLAEGSAAIDSGSELAAPDMDFDGSERPIDGDGNGVARTDVGAFEFVPEPGPFGLAAIAGLLGLAMRQRR